LSDGFEDDYKIRKWIVSRGKTRGLQGYSFFVTFVTVFIFLQTFIFKYLIPSNAWGGKRLCRKIYGRKDWF